MIFGPNFFWDGPNPRILGVKFLDALGDALSGKFSATKLRYSMMKLMIFFCHTIKSIFISQI